MSPPVETTERSIEEGRRLLDEGRALLQQRQWQAALDPLRRALIQLEDTAEERRLLAECRTELGYALVRVSRLDEAIEHLVEALRFFQALAGTERQQARCLYHLGQAQWRLVQYDAAMANQEQALALLRPLPGTECDQGKCHLVLGAVLTLLGRYEEAILKYEEALALFRVVDGTAVDQAQCHTNIGNCLRELQRFPESLARQQTALSLVREEPYTELLQAQCHARIGYVEGDLGRYEAMIEVLEGALALLRQVPGSDYWQASNHANLGTGLMFLGRYAEAIQKHRQALALYQRVVGTERGQAVSHRVIARNLIRLGRPREAIPHLESALELLAPIQGTAHQQASCIQAMGQAFVEMGQYAEALEQYDKALALLESVDAPVLERPMTHRLAGEALRRDGRLEAARERFEQALALYHPEQDREELWQAWYGLGQTREELGDAGGALSAYLTSAEYLEGLRGEIAARANKLAFFQDKAAVYGHMIALLLDGRIPDPVRVDPRLGRWGETAEAIALGLAEAAKGRALSDLLQERDVHTAPPSEWIGEQRRLDEQITRLYAELHALAREPGEAARPLRERIRALELERDILEVRIKRAAPRVVPPPPVQRVEEIQALLDPETALLEYAFLPPARAAAPNPQQRFALWIVTRDTLRVFPLTAPAGQTDPSLDEMLDRLRKAPQELGLAERVRLFRHPMEDRLKGGKLLVREHQQVGQLLGEVVLPAEPREYLRALGVRQLAIVPDGILHHVSFAALILHDGRRYYDTCHYLVEDYTIACLPSATALAALRRASAARRARGPDRRRSLLAFADPVFDPLDPRWPKKGRADTLPAAADDRPLLPPPAGCDTELLTADEEPLPAGLLVERGPENRRLKETGVEVGAVSALFPDAEVYVGFEATKERLRSLPLAQFRYLIFATHGYVDEENPMLSCVHLTATQRDSGFLQAQEIFGLELDADLVTLSTCRSGLGRLASGEGIVGLTTAFFTAGADSLVTSLWPVADKTTAMLVQRLFVHLRTDGISRAEALRRAQLEMIRGTCYLAGHPASAGAPLKGWHRSYANPYCWAFTLLGDWGPVLSHPPPAAGS